MRSLPRISAPTWRSVPFRATDAGVNRWIATTAWAITFGASPVAAVVIGLLVSAVAMSFAEAGASTSNDTAAQKARSLADVAVTLAITQIREATTQKSPAGEVAPWSSQPGAIRVFQPYGDLKAIYKLYSSPNPIAESVEQVGRDDLKTDWNSEPDQWVDINAPMVRPAQSGGKDGERSEPTFPIVDPRAARPEVKDSVEGFSYRQGVSGVVGPAEGRADSQRLPMPVRWLYLLADGTIGTLSAAGEFVASIGRGEPSHDNRIAGRIAFWTDDETCKINVNTASEGVYWDIPRASTEEDRWLGQSQPVNGEYQRYPGHPAMVCLSSVLFPNKRFRAAKSESSAPIDGTIAMTDMDPSEVKSIWRLAPGISGDEADRTSFGGRRPTAGMASQAVGTLTPSRSPPGEALQKPFYNALDDYHLAASSNAAINQKGPDIDDRKPPGGTSIGLPTDRIQQSQFFLTARSASPEVSLGGLPRMALWPVSADVSAELMGIRNRSVLSGSSRYSLSDALIGFNSSLRPGNKVYPYFLQRMDIMSPHTEFYDYSEGRNKILWDYVTRPFRDGIPGFGIRQADLSGSDFRNFAEKYGDKTYDDLPAITAEMMDYIRSQNLYDGGLKESTRYADPGSWGQVTPLCLCGGVRFHGTNWFNASIPTLKGIGRVATVSEVALVVGLRAKQSNGAMNPVPAGVQFHPDNRKLLGESPGSGTDFYEIEVGLLIEGFACAQGWSEFRPQCSFVLGGFSGGRTLGESVSNAATGTKDTSIGTMTLCGRPLVFDAAGTSSTAETSSGAAPKDWIGWGGTLGTRFLSKIITFKPILFSVPAGQSLPPFHFSGSLGSATHLRLMVYNYVSEDNAAKGVNDVGNLIQFIPLAFPENAGGYPLPTTNPRPFRKYEGDDANVPERLQESRATGALYGPNGLIHPGDIVQSLVPNHGDFRLLAAKRAVMQGLTSGVDNPQASEYPTFVAHPNYGREGFPLAHSLTEPKPEMNAILPRPPVPGLSSDFGYFTNDTRSIDLRIRPEFRPDFPIKPWEDTIEVRLVGGLSGDSLANGAISGGREMSLPMREVFNITRYDRLSGSGAAARYKRGAAQPDITGDFDTGVGPAIDGPYVNHSDDGGEGVGPAPYFAGLDATDPSRSTIRAVTASPNRLIPSAGVFGSLPTGVAANVPWQTILFRPDPELSKDAIDPQRRHFGSRHPRDHLFMDMFWMPVVQPYPMGQPFETKGKINMNYQILPFTYITRATALHALFKSEKVMAIPDDRTGDYKIGERDADETAAYTVADANGPAVFRHFIDVGQTLEQWEERFAGTDQASTSRGIKPGAFLSATEICDEWLVPLGQTRRTMVSFWQSHRQTGDNVKERPYATLYPRLTTRSNTYRVHVVAQALRTVGNANERSFRSDRGDQVTREFRGSFLVERSFDPTQPDLKDFAAAIAQGQTGESLDMFYSYRIGKAEPFGR